MAMRPDDHRRKWDKDEFEQLAAERLQAELDDEDRSKKKGNIYFTFVCLGANIAIIIYLSPLIQHSQYINLTTLLF